MEKVEIKVRSLSSVSDRGSLKAFVEIQVGEFVLTDCRIIKEDGKKPWLSMPVLTYKDKFGTTCYKPLIKILDNNLKNEISHVVLETWEKNGSGGDHGTQQK